MITYRRRHDSDTWHWCRNCSTWPTSDYIEQQSEDRPTTGELCNQCLAKEKEGDCEKEKDERGEGKTDKRPRPRRDQ